MVSVGTPDQGCHSVCFWLGIEEDIRYQVEVGDVEFLWLREFGGAWKVHGPLGDERLMLADPKALQYVLQTSGYRYPKRGDWRAQQRMRLGDGLAWAHGEQHRRQRRIMDPAYSPPQLKSFLSLFLRYANEMVLKLKDEEIASSTTEIEPVINMHKWLSRTTLDIIGDAGFGFHFGALDDEQNELSKAYRGLYLNSTLYLPRWDMLFRYLCKDLPLSVSYWLRYLPSRGYSRFREYQDFIGPYGRKLIAQTQKDAKGTEKDVMSVLLRANEAEETRLKLSDEEVVAQISTIILAGHETTASSLSWWFYELCRHPDWQQRVREEVCTMRGKLTERGDVEFSISDLESMHAMQATLKEAMRLHPIVWLLNRTAGQDDIIPLSTPITTESGQKISSIAVRKGQDIEISISSYNRNPDVWGEDAHVWNPARFMHAEKSGRTAGVGVYANLLNFSGGIRNCLGWKFAVLEMEAIAATLIESFEFSLPPQTEENIVERKPSLIMAPKAAGHPGIWMGLKIKSCSVSA
ncbi:cytochrome P450 [Peniophora sp. CONT]|nr:cytochrome P450 [Peniophora sp. CONT]